MGHIREPVSRLAREPLRELDAVGIADTAFVPFTADHGHLAKLADGRTLHSVKMLLSRKH